MTGAANGLGPKKDNTKQTTLFGLPAVPAPEKPEKGSRKKNSAVPSEDPRVVQPETRESQDVEMSESQDGDVSTSQAATVTAVDSQQQESQATEVITTQVKGTIRFHAVLKADERKSYCRRAAPSQLTGLHHHHQWYKGSQMKYVPTECIFTALRVMDCVAMSLITQNITRPASTLLARPLEYDIIGPGPPRHQHMSLCSTPA